MQPLSSTQRFPHALRVVDSHTEGEPTRVVIDGWPELRGLDMAERRADLLKRFDHLRSAVVCEPRGHDAIVGAVLTPPIGEESDAGVIFFNNVGALGMCGHGLIGVVRTLEHIGRIGPGNVQLDTPVGTVSAVLHPDGTVTISNVESYVYLLDITFDVPGVGPVTGDVAWGGNWFFITHLPDLDLSLQNLPRLTDVTQRIMRALADGGITGADRAPIDHVELYEHVDGGARNFVLCPGGAYDRSPCGTGTSAKLAVLHERGELAPGVEWRQESVTGGVFTATYEVEGDGVIPHISGRAFITAESTLYFDARDPFIAGFSASR